MEVDQSKEYNKYLRATSSQGIQDQLVTLGRSRCCARKTVTPGQWRGPLKTSSTVSVSNTLLLVTCTLVTSLSRGALSLVAQYYNTLICKFPLHVQHQKKIIISLSWSSLRNLTTVCSLRNTYYTAYFVIQSLGVEWSQHPVRKTCSCCKIWHQNNSHVLYPCGLHLSYTEIPDAVTTSKPLRA